MLYLSGPQSEESLATYLTELIEEGQEITLDAAAPNDPPLDKTRTKAFVFKVEQFFLSQVGTNNSIYEPVHKSLNEAALSLNADHIDDVIAHLSILRDDIKDKRMILIPAGEPPKAVSDETAPKFFDMVQVTVTLYQGVAASMIGVIILNNKFSHLHQNGLFWGTLAAAASFVLGVSVQASITHSLAIKKTLRESVLSKWTLTQMQTQILFLLVAIGCVGWYAFCGGQIGKP